MYALYQSGFSIAGVGQTIADTKEDASEWLDDGTDLDAVEILDVGSQRAEEYGALYVRPCTVRLAQGVEAHGGDCLYAVNDAGFLDLFEDEC